MGLRWRMSVLFGSNSLYVRTKRLFQFSRKSCSLHLLCVSCCMFEITVTGDKAVPSLWTTFQKQFTQAYVSKDTNVWYWWDV